MTPIEATWWLIERYRNITIDEIRILFGIMNVGVMHNELTNLRDMCVLCETADIDCVGCVHHFCDDAADGETTFYCACGDAYDTWTAMMNANTPEEIQESYRARADYLESRLAEMEQ